MIKFYRFLISFFILMLPFGLSAQNFKEFSEESNKFLDELNSIFSKITVKENQKASEELMIQFTEYWNTGVFTKEIKDDVHEVCNLMLKRRLKGYPDFYYYLGSVTGLMDYDHPVNSYLAWHKSVILLSKDKRSTKPIRTFLQTSYFLLHENVLYRSKATTWKTNSYDFEFAFDSVPEVIFDDINLTCYANKDSAVIYETKGVYHPLKSLWFGKNGKVSWARTGLPNDQVYAELDDYSIQLSFSKYTVDSVQFYNKKYWDSSLPGKLEEKVLANVNVDNASYPRFTSYYMFIEIDSVFEDIDYAGGIEMRGGKLIGMGDAENDAVLTFKKDKKEFVRILSKSFVIYPDRIASKLATATIVCKEDSIYHPGLQINYNHENRELSLIRAGEEKTKSPYYDSFHNLDIYSEAIYWRMGEPTINFEAVKGISGLGKATFESSSYFSEQRYERLQGIDLMNPLNIIKNYTDKFNIRDVHVQGLAEHMRMPQDQVIAMLVNLSNKGFLIYDRDQKSARVKEKLYDYIDAANKKIDYDAIRFNSETHRLQNASLELDSFGLKLNGVQVVLLSDSQNVFIFPQNQQLIIKEGMDFSFVGRIRAGTFDFFARRCNFNYDQFKLDMPVIDSLSFMVSSYEKDEYGQTQLVRVKNVIADLGGDLYIDDPNNKSGLKRFPQYPIFTSTKDAYVYYDKPSIFDGVYEKDKFYFYVYPFTIDSLDNFKTELLEFNGYLASAGIFPDMEDTLKVQRDYSLGFKTKTPPEGLAVYGGKGKYFAGIDLSNNGLRGNGSLQYLTSTTWSDDFVFFPDSCNTFARDFVIREQIDPIEFPAVKGINVMEHWIPYEDRMIVRNTELPFTMFNGQSDLVGMLALSPEQLNGAGMMSFEDAEMQSKLYSFMQHEIFADSADFNLKSTDYMQSAFSTQNYASHIDFNERKGDFVSNGGASLVAFPVNMYVCSLDEFDWFMDSYEIAIGSLEKETEMAQYDNLTIKELIDIPLQGSEFISTHPDQDSLKFISTIATYNLKEYTLYAEDVKYIRIADAAIFPPDRKIIIKPDAKMNTIADAKILANTVTRHHEIYDAVVDIKGKNNYTGIGNYDYVDEKDFRQKIFLRDLGVDPSYQTVGQGAVSDTVGFTISNDFDFSGNLKLFASREFLNFDGRFRIRHQCNPGRRTWVKFNSDVNPKDIYLNVDEYLTTVEGDKLESALMFSNENNKFYSGFFTPRRAASDQPVLKASGVIRFDKLTEVYDIGSLEKLKGNTLQGNQLSLGRKKCILNGQGIMSLGADFGQVEIQTVGSVNHYIIPDSTNFDLLLTIDFPFDDKALEVMTDNIVGKNLQGVNLTRPAFLKALADILGEKESEKIVADLRLFGRFRKYPNELQHTLVFTEVDFQWNYASRSYISRGPIGLGSVGKTQINKYVDGFIEIQRKRTGDVLNIYLELENGRSWYFFNYRNNRMQSISSSTEYNNIIRELKDDKRTEKESKEGDEYIFSISNLRTKTDFLRRVKQ